MVPSDAFRDQPVLTGGRVRLEPLGPAVLDAYWAALNDPEGRGLTRRRDVLLWGGERVDVLDTGILRTDPRP